MEIRDWLSLLSVALSLFAFFYSLLTNTKRYEIRASLRKDILSWFSKTIEPMQELAIAARNKALDSNLRQSLLARLSTQIEVGRFFFPNIEKGEGFGHEKPPAYRGHRNLILDLLVYYYRLFERDDYPKHLRHAHTLERHFTSLVWEVHDPKRFIRESAQVSKRMFNKELTFEDFIDREPEILEEYI